MQTYTHALMGGAIATALFPHEPIAAVAIVAGSIAPDVPLAVQFARDLVTKRPPMSDQPKLILILKEVSHSIPLWLMVAYATTQWPDNDLAKTLKIFAWGVLLHCLVDALTHGGEEYRDTDQGLLWPLKAKLSGLVGIWEYRIQTGSLQPKPFEVFLDDLLTALCAAFWIASRLFPQ